MLHSLVSLMHLLAFFEAEVPNIRYLDSAVVIMNSIGHLSQAKRYLAQVIIKSLKPGKGTPISP